MILGAVILGAVIVAVLGAYVWQMTLNEHSRYLLLTVQDANRVIERIRQQNVGGASPTIVPPVGTSWDAWLADTGALGGGGKSLRPNANEERIVVTCLRRGAPTPPANPADYCGDDDQVGAGEWRVRTDNTDYDPLQITVAVCWRNRSRVVGECAWDGAILTPDDAVVVASDTAGVINPPAILTTLVTCR